MPVTKYVWDVITDTYLMETDENDATTAVYTNEPGQFGPVISQRRGANSHFFHRDGLGSVVDVTDAAEDPTDSYVYKGYGEIVAASGSTVNPFRWVGSLGYYYDLDLLEYYVRARHYNPLLARFVSRDPIEYEGSDINVYCYVSNAPADKADPEGLFERRWWEYTACTRCHAMNWEWQHQLDQLSSEEVTRRVILERCCGKDITLHLADFEKAMIAAFAAAPARTQKGACRSMLGIGHNWDIRQLAWEQHRFSEGVCGTGVCEGTVTVSGSCYWASDVNYFLWGLANRLCHEAGYGETHSLTNMLKLTGAYRGLTWWFGGGSTAGRKAWTIAGYASPLLGGLRNALARPGSVDEWCGPCRHPYDSRLHGYFGTARWAGFLGEKEESDEIMATSGYPVRPGSVDYYRGRVDPGGPQASAKTQEWPLYPMPQREALRGVPE